MSLLPNYREGFVLPCSKHLYLLSWSAFQLHQPSSSTQQILMGAWMHAHTEALICKLVSPGILICKANPTYVLQLHCSAPTKEFTSRSSTR